jgi:EAL domain-containing protein (putative c-di-GMP-specific phosphodiesterase class I)
LASDGAIVRAGMFIATAKRLGALQLVDRVVTEKLMQHIAANGPVKGGATALNLSLESLLDKSFVEWLFATLNAKRDIAKYIIIEVAEHSLISNLEAVKGVFSKLRETGARLSIDRFGQSTATLGFLRGLEVDYIKIDGGYTRGVADSTDKQFFIQALVGIAHGLGIKVITEYVESEMDFTIVKGLMVDGAQGYFIGKPE